MSDNQTFAQDRFPVLPPEWTEYIDMVDPYCLDHVDKIFAGGNPAKDLVTTGLIPDKTLSEGGISNTDCKGVHSMKLFNDESKRLGLSWSD